MIFKGLLLLWLCFCIDCSFEEDQEAPWACVRWTRPNRYGDGRETTLLRRSLWKLMTFWHACRFCPQGSTVSIRVAAVMLVVNIITESTSTNSTYWLSCCRSWLLFWHYWGLCFSHPGYFGKVGMRHFHLTRQRYFRPSINLDKIWSLVSDQTRLKYKDAKPDGKVPVIDVVRAVRVLPWESLDAFFLIVYKKAYLPMSLRDCRGICIPLARDIHLCSRTAPAPPHYSPAHMNHTCHLWKQKDDLWIECIHSLTRVSSFLVIKIPYTTQFSLNRLRDDVKSRHLCSVADLPSSTPCASMFYLPVTISARYFGVHEYKQYGDEESMLMRIVLLKGIAWAVLSHKSAFLVKLSFLMRWSKVCLEDVYLCGLPILHISHPFCLSCCAMLPDCSSATSVYKHVPTLSNSFSLRLYFSDQYPSSSPFQFVGLQFTVLGRYHLEATFCLLC